MAQCLLSGLDFEDTVHYQSHMCLYGSPGHALCLTSCGAGAGAGAVTSQPGLQLWEAMSDVFKNKNQYDKPWC